MFTSRAEFRLSLRADNADQRLTPLGLEVGCVGEDRRTRFENKMEALDRGRTILAAMSITASEAANSGIRIAEDGARRSGLDLLSFADVTFDHLAELRPEAASVSPEIREQLKRDALYANYIERQKRDVDALRKDEAHEIPLDFDFEALSGLSNELRQKLIKVRPATLGQAGRVEGMTPAALTLILAKLRQTQRKSA